MTGIASLPFLARPALDEVHLWQGDLTDLGDLVTLECLSAAENQRLQGIRHAASARRFRLARSGLRVVLGGYLGIPPAAVEIALRDRGKPFVPDSPLQFNISHAGDRVWIVLAWDRAVGVDLEQERPLEVLALARRFFHASEADYLSTLDESSRRTAFFRFWAVKEAYLKATGEGLTGLESAVLSDWDPPALLRIPGWIALGVPAPPGWAGAVAVAGSVPQLIGDEVATRSLNSLVSTAPNVSRFSGVSSMTRILGILHFPVYTSGHWNLPTYSESLLQGYNFCCSTGLSSDWQNRISGHNTPI